MAFQTIFFDERAYGLRERGIRLSLIGRVVHVDEVIRAQRQPAGQPRALESHLMPRHRRGIENVPFAAHELTGIFKASDDLTGLNNPTFRGPWVRVTKY